MWVQGADVVVGVGHLGGRCKDLSNPDDLSSCQHGSELFRLLRALPPGTVLLVPGMTDAHFDRLAAAGSILAKFIFYPLEDDRAALVEQPCAPDVLEEAVRRMVSAVRG